MFPVGGGVSGGDVSRGCGWCVQGGVVCPGGGV